MKIIDLDQSEYKKLHSKTYALEVQKQRDYRRKIQEPGYREQKGL